MLTATMSSGAPGFPIEVLLIPMFLLVTVGGLYLLGQYLKTRVDSDLKNVGAETRRLEVQRRQLEATLQAFEDVDQEPFVSRVNALHSLLSEADALSADLQGERVRIRQKAANLSVTHWRSMLGAPYLWLALNGDVKRLLAGISRVERALQAAGQKELEIQRLGWNIAQQARQARLLQRQVRRIIEPLQARKMGGGAFDQALAEEQQIRSRLETIPEYLYNDDEERVLELLDRETTTAAHNAIAAARPALEALLERARAWAKQAGNADEQVSRLRRALEEVGQTLESLPPIVDTTEAHAQLGGMSQIARTLELTLARLETESIDEVVSEAERQTRLAQELNHLLKRARREGPMLQSALAALSAGFKDISVQTNALSKSKRHPVRWRASVETLGELNRQLTGLGGADRARPPDQIRQDLESASNLRTRQSELAGRVQQVRENHEKLLEQLLAPDLASLDSWIEEARRLAEKVTAYAPENWPRQEAIERLPADLDMLSDDARRLDLSRPEARLDEAQVASRLADLSAFVNTYQALQRRVEALRSRLESLAQQEQETDEILAKARAAIGQLEFIINSNDFLGGIAAQELPRFSEDLQRLGDETKDRRRGRVETRLRQTAALAERLETAANRWLEQLVQEIEAQNSELAGLLKELDGIAELDEQPVEDARHLLSSGNGLPRRSYAGRGPLELEVLIAELKRRSDYWHSANASMHAMQDFHPLIETYQEAAYLRDQAHRALGEAEAGVGRQRTWPPTTVSLDGERQELAKLEKQWQELQNSHAKAIARTSQLGSLAGRYGALTERIAQAAERAARESGDIEDLEADLHDLVQLWQNHLYELQNNPEAAADLQLLLEDISRELGQVRRRYQQGGADYNTVLQTMKTLNRRVRYFQIALDDERALDIQGKIQVRREGKNVRGRF